MSGLAAIRSSAIQLSLINHEQPWLLSSSVMQWPMAIACRRFASPAAWRGPVWLRQENRKQPLNLQSVGVLEAHFGCKFCRSRGRRSFHRPSCQIGRFGESEPRETKKGPEWTLKPVLMVRTICREWPQSAGFRTADQEENRNVMTERLGGPTGTVVKFCLYDISRSQYDIWSDGLAENN
jgi:hypothetical protein